MKKPTRYSPGGYGAMTEDSSGDYVRLSEIEPLIRRAVDHAKDSGILAGSIIADENADELAKARDLLRWQMLALLECFCDHTESMNLVTGYVPDETSLVCRARALVKRVKGEK